MESNCNITVPGTKYQGRTLIKRCVAGDDEAWQAVVSSVVSRVFWLSHRFTNRREDAEDLTQEIFLRVYRNLHQFREDAGSLQAPPVRPTREFTQIHTDSYRFAPSSRSVFIRVSPCPLCFCFFFTLIPDKRNASLNSYAVSSHTPLEISWRVEPGMSWSRGFLQLVSHRIRLAMCGAS